MSPLTAREILAAAKAQLAVDLNCAPEDFSREGFHFREAADHPGRRPFPREESHFDMYTMGPGVVVSATPDLLPRVRRALAGKTRDEAFAEPFVHGQGLYFLPDPARLETDFPTPGYRLRVLERPDILALYPLEGFRYAVQHDPDHPRPDVLAVAAYHDGRLAALAGCSADCESLWQIGIDVLPGHRGAGLAPALVARITAETLRRGKVPYYGTSTANIASQRVAHRVGFSPAWTCAYRGRFDGALTQPSG